MFLFASFQRNVNSVLTKRSAVLSAAAAAAAAAAAEAVLPLTLLQYLACSRVSLLSRLLPAPADAAADVDEVEDEVDVGVGVGVEALDAAGS